MLPVFWKKANAKGFKIYYLIPLVITLALSLFFHGGNRLYRFFAGPTTGYQSSFLCGFLIAGSIVIPGISGSVLLILLGVYGAILNAIATIDIPVLIPLSLGLALGVLVFSKLMG